MTGHTLRLLCGNIVSLALPACFHALGEGFVNLIWTRQGAHQLLTHLLSQVKGQGVTPFSLHQKYAGIAAASGVHCRQRGLLSKIDPGRVLLDSVNVLNRCLV